MRFTQWRNAAWTTLSGTILFGVNESWCLWFRWMGESDFRLICGERELNFYKGTYQNRGRQTVILARLDFGGAPHRNPDGEEVGSFHIHLYREGYGDKWAKPIPEEHFSNPEDHWQLLLDFMRFCNITKTPLIRRMLFP